MSCGQYLTIEIVPKGTTRLTIQSLHEQISVFRYFQSPDGRTQDLYTEPLEDSHFVQLNTDIKSGLTSKGQENSIRSFLLQHIGDVVGSHGQEEDGILMRDWHTARESQSRYSAFNVY